MTVAIFSQALRDYIRFRRLFPWLLLGAVCYLLAFFWTNLVHGATPEDRYVSVVSILAFRILALCSAIFTTSIVSAEVEGRTIVYLLTRPVPRWLLLLTRFAASVIVVTLLGFLILLLTSLASYGGRHNPFLFNDFKAMAFGALGYGGLFLLVSLMVNRAMVYCLLFAFGWETSIPNLSGDLYHLSVYSYVQGIAQHPVKDSSASVISPLASYLTIAIAATATLALSAWWFTHFEYVPREDAA